MSQSMHIALKMTIVHVINTFLNITEAVRTNSKEKFPENQLGGITRLKLLQYIQLLLLGLLRF